MRLILAQALGYPNPVYLATRKTEAKKPILALFLHELRLAQGMPMQKLPAKRRISALAPG